MQEIKNVFRFIRSGGAAVFYELKNSESRKQIDDSALKFRSGATLAGLFAIGVIILIPFFLHLEKLPIRIWDEARLAMNAYEMNKNGNYLVTHFDGQPDMWNTKPPLVIWLQVASIKIFGFNEWAIRFPSACLGFLTCVLLCWFSIRYWNNPWPGLLASLILVTTNGYIHIHASRTGDYDTPLAFFTTFFLLNIFLYIERKEIKYLHGFFIGVALAVLTKSIQGLIFLPAAGLYVCLFGDVKRIVTNRFFIIDSLLALFVVAAYYLLREHFNPGYLQAIWENELGGRYLTTLEDNQFSNTYYLEQLRFFLLPIWFYLVPVGIVLGLVSKTINRKFISFISVSAVSYLLIISFSETKLEWYTVPLFPLFAIIVGFLFWELSQIIKNRFTIFNNANYVLPILFLPIFAYAYYTIGAKVYRPTEYEWDKDLYPISRILQEAHQGHRSLEGYSICYEGYNTQLLCYVRSLHDKGADLQFRDVQDLVAGQRVLAAEPNVKKTIEDTYDVAVERTYYNVTFYKILAERKAMTNLGLTR